MVTTLVSYLSHAQARGPPQTAVLPVLPVFILWALRLSALFSFPVITPVPEQLNQACKLAGHYLQSRALRQMRFCSGR